MAAAFELLLYLLLSKQVSKRTKAFLAMCTIHCEPSVLTTLTTAMMQSIVRTVPKDYHSFEAHRFWLCFTCF